jgi:hypothetical protein
MANRLHRSYDSFDFSVAGFVTDYLISVIGVLCGFVVLWLRCKHQAPIPLRVYLTFSVFSFMAALAFLYGGIGHMMIGFYAARGVPLGMQWGAAHNHWMYAWLPAVFFMPAAAFANMSVIFAAYHLPDWTQALPQVVGLCIGVVEVVMMSDESLLTDYSGMPAALSFLISSSTIIVMACIKAVRVKKKGMGMWVIMAGNILIFLAWLFLSLTPTGCKKYSETERDCPYSNDFNQNPIFHVIIMVALVTEFFGVKGCAEEMENHGDNETRGKLLFPLE